MTLIGNVEFVEEQKLPGCITYGETVESAVANTLDAKKAWLEAAMEDGIEIHEPDSLNLESHEVFIVLLQNILRGKESA